MAAMAFPLHRKVAAVACWHHPVAQIVPFFPACHTLVFFAVQVVAIHTPILIPRLVHEAQLNGGGVITDALRKAAVLHNNSV